MGSLYKDKDVNFFERADLGYIYTEVACTIFTIIGNGIVLLVFWSDTQKNESQKIIHKYIVSMAWADLLMGIMGIQTSIYVSVGLPHNRFWCLFFISIQTSFGMISVLALVAASTAKYLSLAHPLWFSTKFTEFWAVVHILAHWLVGALIGCLPSMGLNKAPNVPPIWYRNNTQQYEISAIEENDLMFNCKSNETHICYREFKCYFTQVIPAQMSLVLMFGVIVPSCLVLIVIYVRIYLIFKQTIQKRSKSVQNINSDQGDKLRKREIRTTSVLFITVVFFGICWIPLYVIDILSFLAPESVDISLMGINALIIMRHVNSVFNPFLYAYHMKGFREVARHALSRIFCCADKRHPGWRPSNVAVSSSTDNTIENNRKFREI